jgi:cell division protein FtsI (penicillin-binding protein 3)/stage V sporulation protein D (sporulation-specific penicillin-binding protein)
MHQDVYKIRLSVVAMVIALGFVLLAARLYQIQILRHGDLYGKARAQYSASTTLKGSRGQICDIHGNLLAGNLACRDVYAEPKKFEAQLRGVTDYLSRKLGLPRAEVAEKLGQAFRPANPRVEVVVARGVDLRVAEDLADDLAKQKIKGFRFEENYRRYYPKDSLLANTLGFISGDGKGDSGVEKAFDKELQPTTSRTRYQVDRKGHLIPFTETELTPRNGSNVYLTIDEAIQQIVETELKLMVDKFHPKSAYAVMADPKTGAILAMAQLPTYNPNNRQTMSPDSFRNRILEDAFEPGSIMKGVTITGALDWGLTNLDEKIFCENGLWWYAGKSLRDSGHRYGWLQTRQIVQVSSNIGTAKLAIRLGSKRMYDLLVRFGFGKRTGLNLGVESPGILPSLNKWSGLSIARLPIGQGIAVTPLQMVQAYCAIANNGFMPQLHILDRIEDPETHMFDRSKWENKRRVVTNDKAIADVTEALQLVTHEGGTAPKAAVKGYEVAGKTGTAQKVVGGQYSNSAYTASFIGFVPAEDPRFVLLVVADEPDRRIAYYGSTVTAPTFSSIAEKTLRYLMIAPAKPGAAPPAAATTPTPPPATPTETAPDADFTPDPSSVP